MRRLAAAAFVLSLGLAAAHAQTAPDAGSPPGAPSAQPPATQPTEAPPPAQPPAMQPSGAATAPAAQPTGKEVRAQCRADAIAQGLKGPARKAAVDDCFAKARPDLAKRQQCVKEGKAQGLADKPLHQFVRKCVTGA